MQLVHQFHTILFNVCQKRRVHVGRNMHNVKFQQGGQFLALHPEGCPAVLRHPIHGQIDVAVVSVVSSGAGAEQHQPLCAVSARQCGQLAIQLFHGIPSYQCVRPTMQALVMHFGDL